ncbi:DUF1156 domain-containing protein [Candidatus Bathyarchaeota archaeon]|nr:DUF1156 domain-containing protein [Candidatus Bathyarchaeota archaeon]
MEKTLLEEGISVEQVNVEAEKEKIGRSVPPISNMQYYFTRKPLISARMVIAATLLNQEDVSDIDFNKLIGLNENQKKRAYWEFPMILKQKIKEKYPNGVTILDPFAGGGMIPFEALRMGVNCIAVDYNPVSYLIMKGTLEYPIKYGALKKSNNFKLFADVKRYSKQIISELESEIKSNYPKHNGIDVRAYIYAWEVKCPTCGKLTPLVNNWWLDSKDKIGLSYELISGEIVYSIKKGQSISEGNIKNRKCICINCTSEIPSNAVLDDINRNYRETLLAVYLENGKFELPTQEDLQILDEIKNEILSNAKKYSPYIPVEAIPEEARALPAGKYIQQWFRLFNYRQLMLMALYVKKTRELLKEISINDFDYAGAIGTYLTFILTKHVQRNCRSTSWHYSNKQISHLFASRGVNMRWDHTEVNPFVKFSGTFQGIVDDVLSGLSFSLDSLNKYDWELTVKPSIEIYNESIIGWKPKNKIQFIITDPPYYDDVPYPELMHVFQIWYSKILSDYIDIPSTIKTNDELSVGGDRGDEIYEKRMNDALKSLYNIIDDDGVVVLYYVHKSIKGWSYLLESLRKIGFSVTSTISLMTENTQSSLSKGKSSIFHSLLLTARKRTEHKIANIIDIEDEIKSKMELRYTELEKLYGKDRMNLMVAASGIVIEIITSYDEIKSFTKNTSDYALEMGQKYLIELFAQNALKIRHIDPKTMVYVWFRYSLRDDIDYSEFNQTLKALGVSEYAIEDIIDSKKKDKIRLLDYIERASLEIDGMEPLVAQTVIDATQIALRAYMRGGINSATYTVENSPFGSQTILNTIDALGRIHATKPQYKEGETCLRFITDWNALHGKPTKLDHFSEEKQE